MAARLMGRATGASFGTQAKTFWGASLRVVLPEAVSVQVFRFGFTEYALTRMVLALVRDGATFFDIGACFGYYTVMASDLVGSKGNVVAFEPTPRTFRLLERNTAGRENVTVLPFAAYAKRGVVKIRDYGPSFAAFNSLMEPRLEESERRRVREQTHLVPAVSIDEIVADLGYVPTFIKIDAEGAELGILEGMGQTLRNHRPMITLEVGDVAGEGTPSSQALVRHMMARGYWPYEFRDGRCVEHTVQERYGFANLLFCPQGRPPRECA